MLFQSSRANEPFDGSKKKDVRKRCCGAVEVQRPPSEVCGWYRGILRLWVDHAVKRRATLAMTEVFRQTLELMRFHGGHTVQSNNAEDEDDGQSHDNNGVDLETGGLIGVQPWNMC